MARSTYAGRNTPVEQDRGRSRRVRTHRLHGSLRAEQAIRRTRGAPRRTGGSDHRGRLGQPMGFPGGADRRGRRRRDLHRGHHRGGRARLRAATRRHGRPAGCAGCGQQRRRIRRLGHEEHGAADGERVRRGDRRRLGGRQPAPLVLQGRAQRHGHRACRCVLPDPAGQEGRLPKAPGPVAGAGAAAGGLDGCVPSGAPGRHLRGHGIGGLLSAQRSGLRGSDA